MPEYIDEAKKLFIIAFDSKIGNLLLTEVKKNCDTLIIFFRLLKKTLPMPR